MEAHPPTHTLLFWNAERKFVVLIWHGSSAGYWMDCFDRYKMKADRLSPPDLTAAGHIIPAKRQTVSPVTSFTLRSLFCNMAAVWKAVDK